MILYETVEKLLQQSDPLAWIQASEADRAKWVSDYHAMIQDEQAQISQQMAPPTMTGNYLEDVAALKAQQRLAEELAMPTPLSESEQRDVNRQFWTHWAKQNPTRVKPQVMTLLKQWDQIFDTSEIGEIGPYQWQENNPIYFEESTPYPLDEESLIEQWDWFVQPMIDNYVTQVILEPFLPVDTAMWDLTEPHITMEDILKILRAASADSPALQAFLLTDQAVKQAVALLATEIGFEILPEDTTPAWLIEYRQLNNGDQD